MKRKPKRYNYVHEVALCGFNISDTHVRRILRKLVREAVLLGRFSAPNLQEDDKGAADRIAKELVP